MNKFAAILLLSLFSTILVTETFSYAIDDFNGMELVENDGEGESEKGEKEKDLSDEFLPEKLEGIFATMQSSKSLTSYHSNLSGEYSEITIPPPEVA